MNYEAGQFYIAAVALFLSIIASVVAVVAWWGGRSRVTQKAIDRVEANSVNQHNEQELRIARLEEGIRNALTTAQLNEALKPLYDRVNQNGEQYAGLNASIKSIENTLRDFMQEIMRRSFHSP